MSLHIVSGKIATEIKSGLTPNNKPKVQISIPNKEWNGTENVDVWYNVTIYGKDADFVTKNFRKGTVLELQCGFPTAYVGNNGKAGISWKAIPGTIKPLENYGKQNASQQPASPQPTSQGANQNNQKPAPTLPAYDPAAGDDDDVPF